MPFIDFNVNNFIGNFSQNIYRKPKKFKKYIEPIDEQPIGSLEISTMNGGTVGKIYTSVEKPILESIKFSVEKLGGKEFEFTLSELPEFPLNNFATILFKLDNEPVFGGYIYDTPENGTTKRQALKIKGFGHKKRLEETTIQTKENYQIASINFSNPNLTFVSTTPLDLSNIQIGCKVFIEDVESDLNKGLFTITSFTSNSITVNSVFGTSQSIVKGKMKILPFVWSQSNSLVSDVLIYIIERFGTMANGTPLFYNPSLIDETTGIFIAGVIDFNKLSLLKCVQSLQSILGNEYQIFIDSQGFWNCKKKSEFVEGVLNVGFNLNDFELKLDYNKIKNVITVMRAGQKTESGNSVLGAIAEPQDDVSTSIAKYGRKEEKIEVPSFFSNEACQLIANQTLALKKEPRFEAKAKKLDLKNYPFGNYKIITSEDNQKLILHEFDSLINWTLNGLNCTLNNLILKTGSKSFKLLLDVIDNNNFIEYIFQNSISIIQKQYIEIYIRSNKIGNLAKLKLEGNNDFKEIDLSFSEINEFLFVQIDIKNMTSSFLNSFRITFQNLIEPTEIYIDEISLNYFGVKHLELPLVQANYTISNSNKSVDLDLGLESDKLEDFLAGVKASKDNQSLYLNR